MKLSQTLRILAYLSNGNTLTPLDALHWFGCSRLAARIQELRNAGFHIITDYETSGEKRYAKYRLERAA